VEEVIDERLLFAVGQVQPAGTANSTEAIAIRAQL